MPTNKELEAELAQARRDIDALAAIAADKAADRANGIASGIDAALGSLSQEARAVFDTARSEGAKMRGAVEDQIRDRPLPATALALGLGALIALLLMRR